MASLQLVPKFVWYEGEQYVQFDEAISLNYNFGTNTGRYDNGQIEYREKACAATVGKQHTFVLIASRNNDLQFAVVEDPHPEDSLSELLNKHSFKVTGRVPFYELMDLLGTVTGFAFKYFSVVNPPYVTFSGLDSRLQQLYLTVMRSGVVKASLADKKLKADIVNGNFVISKED